MTKEDDRVKAALALFAAIERGDRAALLDLYAENAVQVEHPNRLKPKGERRGPAKMAEDLARGKQMLLEEHYEVIDAAVSGDRVALLRAYDKATGADVGAVEMPDKQTGSPMTYMINGKQYIVVAVSGLDGAQLIAYALP